MANLIGYTNLEAWDLLLLYRGDAKQQVKGKFGNKRPGIPCGQAYISWRKKCSKNKTAIAKERLKGTGEGKAYANRVRKFKGLAKGGKVKDAAFKFNSIEDANKALESIGISGHWRTESRDDIYSPLTMEGIEKATTRVAQLKNLYPGAKLTDIGEKFQVEHARWEAKSARALALDKELYEQRGKKWRKHDAKKRLRIPQREPKLETFKSGIALGEAASWSARGKDVDGFTMMINAYDKEATPKEEKAGRRRQREIYGFITETGDSMETVVNHEFGHILDFTYGLKDNPRISSLFKEASQSEGGIERAVSTYGATNEREFIAEAFADSFFDDASPMSKRVRAEMDAIIKEADAKNSRRGAK